MGGLNLQAGPQFSILTTAEQDGVDVKDQLKSSDVAGAIGAGFDAPFGLNVTARYIFGLSDVSDIPDTELKNNMFQLSLGYRLFKIGN